jgi:hypothetical protein
MVKVIRSKEFVSILHNALKGLGSQVTFKLDLDEECDTNTGSYNSGTLTVLNYGEPILRLELVGTDVQEDTKPYLYKCDE